MAQATSDASFERDVLLSDRPVLVDFWAEWCGPCRMLGPILDRVTVELAGRARVLKLNVDENPVVARRYGISAIPTVLVFHNGRVAQQIVGVRPERAYVEAARVGAPT
ncbi:MAG: thioredoxin [Spirochaetales bacterium]|nr:thioredoxin [Leptospiraceae bacterium]MCP5482233.1 thioredoxin [Spirochaetales bacterium]MCP5484655.1 thioredoxin [Spirochaetales bacterium]